MAPILHTLPAPRRTQSTPCMPIRPVPSTGSLFEALDRVFTGGVLVEPLVGGDVCRDRILLLKYVVLLEPEENPIRWVAAPRDVSPTFT